MTYNVSSGTLSLYTTTATSLIDRLFNVPVAVLIDGDLLLKQMASASNAWPTSQSSRHLGYNCDVIPASGNIYCTSDETGHTHQPLSSGYCMVPASPHTLQHSTSYPLCAGQSLFQMWFCAELTAISVIFTVQRPRYKLFGVNAPKNLAKPTIKLVQFSVFCATNIYQTNKRCVLLSLLAVMILEQY